MSSPSQDRGLQIGSLVKLLTDIDDEQGWMRGDIVRFHYDDQSNIPLFSLPHDHNNQKYVSLAKTQNFDGVAPMPAPINLQQMAIDTFTTMIERAEKHRAGNHQSSDDFNGRYGICDNVYLCMPQEHKGRYHDHMMHVKDNLVRQVDSFSGSYHYPVPAPVDLYPGETKIRAAERAFDNCGEKWKDGYGDLRLLQAKEILEWVTNNWTDDLTGRYTPAKRRGIREGVVVQHTETQAYYTIYRDDDSDSPYFLPFGETNAEKRKEIRLRDLIVVKVDKIEKRSISSLVNEMTRRIKKRKALEDKIAAMQKEVEQMKLGEIGLDFALASQHNVRMLNK